MSDLFSISPKGAFSCEWNKGTDHNVFCVVKLAISMHAFLTALFSKYTVCISEVSDSFLENNSSHRKSLFGKEYRKKLIAMRSCLKNREVDVSKGDKEALGRVLVEDVEEFVKNGEFDKAFDIIRGVNIELIKPKDCCRLFMMAYEECPSDTLQVTLAQLLLSTGHCDELLNSLFDKKENPLSFFIDNNAMSGVIYIIENIADAVHLTGEGGYTPLMMAAAYGHIDFIESLVNRCVDINACDKNGMTALHYAVSNHQLSAIDFLLDRKHGLIAIIANVRNNEGMTALHLSVKNDEQMHENNGECSNMLVLNGNFDINAEDNKKRTPLHIACMEGSDELIDSLLGLKGILLNEEDCDGCTPLHYAAPRCKESVLSKLLQGGGSISINVKNNVGYTPLQIVKERNENNLSALFKKYKKMKNKPSHVNSTSSSDADADAESKGKKIKKGKSTKDADAESKGKKIKKGKSTKNVQ